MRGFAPVLLALSSCWQADRPIPVGVYYAEEGVEQLYVDSKGIYFAVSFASPAELRPDLFTRRYFTYSLWPDGRIVPLMHSSEWVVSRYEWRWIDGKIAKIDPESDEAMTWFIRGR